MYTKIHNFLSSIEYEIFELFEIEPHKYQLLLRRVGEEKPCLGYQGNEGNILSYAKGFAMIPQSLRDYHCTKWKSKTADVYSATPKTSVACYHDFLRTSFFRESEVSLHIGICENSFRVSLPGCLWFFIQSNSREGAGPFGYLLTMGGGVASFKPYNQKELKNFLAFTNTKQVLVNGKPFPSKDLSSLWQLYKNTTIMNLDLLGMPIEVTPEQHATTVLEMLLNRNGMCQHSKNVDNNVWIAPLGSEEPCMGFEGSVEEVFPYVETFFKLSPDVQAVAKAQWKSKYLWQKLEKSNNKESIEHLERSGFFKNLKVEIREYTHTISAKITLPPSKHWALITPSKFRLGSVEVHRHCEGKPFPTESYLSLTGPNTVENLKRFLEEQKPSMVIFNDGPFQAMEEFCVRYQETKNPTEIMKKKFQKFQSPLKIWKEVTEIIAAYENKKALAEG